jgi:hypothetical protein
MPTLLIRQAGSGSSRANIHGPILARTTREKAQYQRCGWDYFDSAVPASGEELRGVAFAGWWRNSAAKRLSDADA